MDFYKNPSTLYKWHIAILIACILLTAFNLYRFIFTEIPGYYLGLFTPLLLAIGMAIEIRNYRKSKKSNSAANENQ